jgi:extracellular matrix regulatory protein A
MKLLHVGFSNSIAIDKIVAIISPETAVAKRLRDQSRESNNLIDCTMGRKLRSMVLTDSDFVFMSAMRPEALTQRMEKPVPGDADAPVDD